MKFVREWKGCLLNKNNTVLKANDISEIPQDIERCTFQNNFFNQSHIVNSVCHGRCQAELITSGKKQINEYEGIEFTSENGKAYFDPKLIKSFMQKSSKFYLPGNNSQMLIQNKNYVILIAPMHCDIFTPMEA